MEFDNIHRYYLRTSTTPDGKGYPTLADAQVALDNLVNAQSVDASSVTEEPDGKWVIRHGSAGSLKVWIEDDRGATVRLND
jgi:hypothetical protein